MGSYDINKVTWSKILPHVVLWDTIQEKGEMQSKFNFARFVYVQGLQPTTVVNAQYLYRQE